MKKQYLQLMSAALVFAVLGMLLIGCDDSSDSIPTYSSNDPDREAIAQLMDNGWNDYAVGNFTAARQCFQSANQRNAFYLPAYDGLGWCAVRLNDFSDAEVQFSFITTLADANVDPDLLADAYAGLCLSATIERLALEIAGEGGQEDFDALTQESIDMAEMVFGLVGENYTPVQHDPGFSSESLHLMNAQNYFYLQDFGSCEDQLYYADELFTANQLTDLGDTVPDEEMLLVMTVTDEDTAWTLEPANPAIHDIVELTPDNAAWEVDYSVSFGSNEIHITPREGTVLVEGGSFTVTYVYVTDLPLYLNNLIAHIQSIIQI